MELLREKSQLQCFLLDPRKNTEPMFSGIRQHLKIARPTVHHWKRKLKGNHGDLLLILSMYQIHKEKQDQIWWIIRIVIHYSPKLIADSRDSPTMRLYRISGIMSSTTKALGYRIIWTIISNKTSSSGKCRTADAPWELFKNTMAETSWCSRLQWWRRKILIVGPRA